MKDINYALAPVGATHSYLYGWRMTDGVKWYSWTALGWSPLVSPVMCHEYEPIPEKERLKNWLADQPEWPKKLPEQFKGWALFSMQVERQVSSERAEVIHKSNIDKLRTARLEAGLIKENNDLDHVNDTDAVEIEDDLTWLAKNVKYWVWHPNSRIFKNSANEACWCWSFDQIQYEKYNQKQWLQRRRELGLIGDDTKPQEWINEMPPMGTKCEYRDELWYEDERFDECEFIGRRSNGMLVVLSEGDYMEYHAKAVKFRPAKTAEQIAAEKKKEWKHNLMDKLAFHIAPESTAENHIDLAASIVYDSLLDGTLEAPKGDL